VGVSWPSVRGVVTARLAFRRGNVRRVVTAPGVSSPRRRGIVMATAMARTTRTRPPIVQPAARARALTIQAAHRASRARRELAVVVPLIVVVLLAYVYREEVFGLDLPVRVAAAMVLVILGWRLARDVGRSLAPPLFARMDEATAGTVGFLIRLVFLIAVVFVALRIAGLDPRALAISGAIAAVVFGLAAQQTLGNLIAVVLLAVRPFRVGDRVRLQSGSLAGEMEGVVSTLGLLYTTFARGEDSVMVPNNIVLGSAVVPLREPAAVDLRARLRPDVVPSEIQDLLHDGIRTPVRSEPHVGLEEVDADEVIVRIAATPAAESDGPRLADEILAAIAPVTREGNTEERGAAPRRRRADRRPAGDAGVRVVGRRRRRHDSARWRPRRRRARRASEHAQRRVHHDRDGGGEDEQQRERHGDRRGRGEAQHLVAAVGQPRGHAPFGRVLRHRAEQPTAVAQALGVRHPGAPDARRRPRLPPPQQRPARQVPRAPLPVHEQVAGLVQLVDPAGAPPGGGHEPGDHAVGDRPEAGGWDRRAWGERHRLSRLSRREGNVGPPDAPARRRPQAPSACRAGCP
jgi:small conductance mechanosensitive channel